jgi:hypothetical protein
MKVIKSRKGIALLAVLVVAAVASFGAYAYFTNSGTGTGSATVGTSVAATITGTSSANLYPGGPSVPVSITVKNNGSGHQFVDTVHFVSADAFSGPGFTNPIPVGVGAGKCDTSQFSMADVVVGEDLAAGATSTIHTGSLFMANDAAHTQDACQGATLRLNLTSN